MNLQLQWSVPDPRFEQDRAVETIVDRTNCTTPNRNTLRRSRPSSNCELFSEDSCLKTPSPDCKRVVKNVGPPKIDPRSRHKSHSGDKALWNADKWDHYLCQFQDLCKYELEGPEATAAMDKARSILGSPFPESPSTLPSESAPCSGETHFPPEIVAYDPPPQERDVFRAFQPQSMLRALAKMQSRLSLGRKNDMLMTAMSLELVIAIEQRPGFPRTSCSPLYM